MLPFSKLNPFLLFTALFALLTGCTPKASPSATGSSRVLPENAAVLVLNPNQPLPNDCQRIEKIRAGGMGIGCLFDSVVENAKAQARKLGGNVVKITGYRDEGLEAPCYQIRADVYHSDNADQLIAADQARKDSLHRAKFGDQPRYAILYVYRPSGPGALIGYNLHCGDSVLCRLKNYSKYEVRLYKEGLTRFWASTEAKATISLNIQFGEEYYLKSAIQMGFFVGEPSFVSIAKGLGEGEYAAINYPRSK